MIISLPTRWRHVAAAIALAAAAATGLSACGDDASASGGGDGTQVKLGYFPNLTHGTALVGMENGYYEDQLAEDGASVQFAEFDSGSDTITALLNGDLAATYIGPVPAVTAYSQSQGNVSVIAGAAAGGAALVVSDDISSIEDLEGKTIATPGEFNTQDVAARAYFKEQGFEINADGSGDINLSPQDNSVIIQAFRQGEIDGAWVPEPYASIMVSDGGHVLLDESEIWPGGEFNTTNLLVNDDFLEEYPDLVADLVAAHVEANDFINNNTDEAKQLIDTKLAELTGAELPDDVFESAWSNLSFTNDPLASTLEKDAADSYDAGAIEEPIDDIGDVYNLDPLNEILAEKGEEQVPVP